MPFCRPLQPCDDPRVKAAVRLGKWAVRLGRWAVRLGRRAVRLSAHLLSDWEGEKRGSGISGWGVGWEATEAQTVDRPQRTLESGCQLESVVDRSTVRLQKEPGGGIRISDWV